MSVSYIVATKGVVAAKVAAAGVTATRVEAEGVAAIKVAASWNCSNRSCSNILLPYIS